MESIRESINSVLENIKEIVEAKFELYIIQWKEDDGFEYFRVYHNDISPHLLEISPAREMALPNSNRVGRIEVNNSFGLSEHIIFYKNNNSQFRIEVPNEENLNSFLLGKINKAYFEFTGNYWLQA